MRSGLLQKKDANGWNKEGYKMNPDIGDVIFGLYYCLVNRGPYCEERKCPFYQMPNCKFHLYFQACHLLKNPNPSNSTTLTC